MAETIITRAFAKANGIAAYYTGKPCKHQHIAIRRTINGVCVECEKLIEQRYRERHPEKLRDKWRRDSARSKKVNPERIRRNQRKWASLNPEKIREKHRRWRAANPDKDKAHGKRWRDTHADYIKNKNKEYKTANAERLAPIAIARTKKWRAKNPEQARANGHKSRQTRRARMYEAGGSYTNAQIHTLLEKQNWKCAGHGCGSSLRESKELDHIKPLARGGSNDITNLQWLCMPCNRKKRDKDPIEWARENGRLI